MQYITIQYSIKHIMVHYDKYCAESTIQWSMIQYGEVWYNTVQYKYWTNPIPSSEYNPIQ